MCGKNGGAKKIGCDTRLLADIGTQWRACTCSIQKNVHPQKIGAPKGDSDRGPLEASGWLSSCDPFLQLLFWLKLF